MMSKETSLIVRLFMGLACLIIFQTIYLHWYVQKPIVHIQDVVVEQTTILQNIKVSFRPDTLKKIQEKFDELQAKSRP